jgi:hypothetical protein
VNAAIRSEPPHAGRQTRRRALGFG